MIADHAQTPYSRLPRTAQNAVQSPLLPLPAELRNQIWALLYKTARVTVMRSQRRYRKTGTSSPKTFQAWPAKCLPQPVCKQYWVEATGLFFSTATFDFGMGIFLAFARSPLTQAILSHIKRLSLWSNPDNSRLHASDVGRVSNLEGPHRFLWLSVDHRHLVEKLGVMHASASKKISD